MDTHDKVLAWRDCLEDAEAASRQGNRDLAGKLYKEALDLSMSLSEQELVTSLIHLADFRNRGQEFDQAEPLYRRAAEIYERTFGPNNLIGAMCWRSLGEVLDALGKHDEAEKIKSKALNILGTLA